MSETPYKDMELADFISERTGRALMQLGEGCALRSLIADVVIATCYWKNEREKSERTKKEQENEHASLSTRCAICGEIKGSHSAGSRSCPNLNRERFHPTNRFQAVKT